MDTHEQLLAAALKKAQTALSKKSTTENIKAAETARKALKDYQAEQAAAADPSSRRFSTLNGKDGVLGYLQEQGWKIEKSKLHNDRNKIPREPDGTYSKASVDDYARYALERRDGTDSDMSDEARRKARAEAELREEQLKKIKLANEIETGKWVLKSEVEQKHTQKLALLMTAIGNFINSGKLEEGCELVSGAKEKVPAFKEFFNKEFRAMLGEYAKRPEFTVPVAAMAEAEELIKEVEG